MLDRQGWLAAGFAGTMLSWQGELFKRHRSEIGIIPRIMILGINPMSRVGAGWQNALDDVAGIRPGVAPPVDRMESPSGLARGKEDRHRYPCQGVRTGGSFGGLAGILPP